MIHASILRDRHLERFFVILSDAKKIATVPKYSCHYHHLLQSIVSPLNLCGIGLMVFPYFISNLYILILSGIILVALPYFIKI